MKSGEYIISINSLLLKKLNFLILLFWFHSSRGQTNNSFILSGTINVDSGMINLYQSGNITAYPGDFNFSPVPVRKGKFMIVGEINATYEVRLYLKVGNQVKYISEGFFIEPGIQTIICNADSSQEIPNIQNTSMYEYLKEYRSKEYYSLDTISNYQKQITARNEYLFKYTQKHPDSYVSLWEISVRLMRGYDSQIDSAFTELSDKIKSSYPGMLIQDDINHLRLTRTGAEFPTMNVVDLQSESHEISWRSLHSKYILVDFWFSHCSACIDQFPNYIKIVNDFQNKGFTMIGISIDTSAVNIKAWKDVIKNKSLNWSQFRVPRETTDNLRISLYPTNFLLDGSGRIIANNIDTKQLSDFLEAKLKSPGAPGL
jgi:thiol-disulfide isomerase/thioredoxin